MHFYAPAWKLTLANIKVQCLKIIRYVMLQNKPKKRPCLMVDVWEFNNSLLEADFCKSRLLFEILLIDHFSCFTFTCSCNSSPLWHHSVSDSVSHKVNHHPSFWAVVGEIRVFVSSIKALSSWDTKATTWRHISSTMHYRAVFDISWHQHKLCYVTILSHF